VANAGAGIFTRPDVFPTSNCVITLQTNPSAVNVQGFINVVVYSVLFSEYGSSS